MSKGMGILYTLSVIVIVSVILLTSSLGVMRTSNLACRFANAPIDFIYPYLGNVGNCNLQGHKSSETYKSHCENWSFMCGESFSNGVAKVIVNGETNTWTMLALDKPLFHFGRYDCGFVREDRPNGGHAIYMTLFFNGVCVGAEHLRKNYNPEDHTWTEYDDVPKPIHQIGGEEWEPGFLTISDSVATSRPENRVDVTLMILRHDQPVVLSTELRNKMRSATESDIRVIKEEEVEKRLNLFSSLIAPTGSDVARISAAYYHLERLFFEFVLQWKLFHASNREKRKIDEMNEYLDQLQQECDEVPKASMRGSHSGSEWNENLYLDLLNYWLLEGADKKCWNVVSEMGGIIDGHAVSFHLGFATVKQKMEIPIEREPDMSPLYPIPPPIEYVHWLFKVEPDFYREQEFVYVKVIGGEIAYCYTVYPSKYVVKVDDRGVIVKWYPCPEDIGTLREWLEPTQTAVRSISR